MSQRLRENGLILAMTVLFGFSLAGQIVAGWSDYNDDQREHGSRPVELPAYLTTGHFGEALFENWESEFLQMGVFVLLTVHLRQKGSPESKALDSTEEVDREPDPARPGAPWPVRVGGIAAALYRHSLGLALLTLFAISFALHVVTGAAEASADQLAARRGRHLAGGVPRRSPVVVRVVPELAERVHVDRGAGRAVDLPAREGIA